MNPSRTLTAMETTALGGLPSSPGRQCEGRGVPGHPGPDLAEQASLLSPLLYSVPKGWPRLSAELQFTAACLTAQARPAPLFSQSLLPTGWLLCKIQGEHS